MSSFQVTITPSKRAAGRVISRARRVIQRALAEEAHRHGLTQSDLARALGINRSVINREIQGTSDITLGRVGELAWALGRRATITLGALPIHPSGLLLSRLQERSRRRHHLVSSLRQRPRLPDVLDKCSGVFLR